MIQLVLLTGFLGAGKTTLLQHLLEHFQNTPVGLIVNDFGKINIDARLLEKDGVTMAELENGSIFCACIKDNFISSLIELSGREIDYLFIEASGLADPGNIRQILTSVESRSLNKYDYKGSVCILDAESFPEMAELLPTLKNQLKQAGSIIINKKDLISEEESSGMIEKIRSVNPEAPLSFSSYCRVDVVKLLNHLRLAGPESGDSTNTPENRPTTIILKPQPSISMEELRSFLEFAAPFTYRIKGFVRISKAVYSVSGVRSHIMILPWAGEIDSPEIVLISAVGIGLTSAIAEGIRKYAPDSLRI